jgi:hypothetical protein
MWLFVVPSIGLLALVLFCLIKYNLVLQRSTDGWFGSSPVLDTLKPWHICFYISEVVRPTSLLAVDFFYFVSDEQRRSLIGEGNQ